MASPPPTQHSKTIVEHIPGFLTRYSDGSFDRPTDLDLPACPEFMDGVASKDVVLDSAIGVWVRIFLPQIVAEEKDEEETKKMPVVLHIHGGGFCGGTPATLYFHHFCSRMAVKSRCMWVSVNYRLAPENRLPAAYDDAYSALCWLHSQASGGDSSGVEPWLAQHADFSRCFFAGESAGATILHFLAVRAAAKDWSPIRIKGLLAIHGGYFQAKPSVIEGFTAGDLNLDLLEFYHGAALPLGASSWGHPYLNPLHPDWPKLSKLDLPPTFVAVAEKDILREGAEQYYEELRKAGKEAELFSSEDESHCFHLHPQASAAAEVLEEKMIEFIQKHSRD